MANETGVRADESAVLGVEADRSIQGQVLRRSAHREVAIYLRAGELWIADFVDGDGRLMSVPTWLRFNCPTLASEHAHGRMVRECAMPLTQDLVARIEALHRQAASEVEQPKRGES